MTGEPISDVEMISKTITKVVIQDDACYLHLDNGTVTGIYVGHAELEDPSQDIEILHGKKFKRIDISELWDKLLVTVLTEDETTLDLKFTPVDLDYFDLVISKMEDPELDPVT